MVYYSGVDITMFFYCYIIFLGGSGMVPLCGQAPTDHENQAVSLSSHCSHRMGGKVSFKVFDRFQFFFCLRFSILLLIPHWCTSFVPSLGSKHFPASQQHHGSMAGLRFRGTHLGTKVIGCRAWINMDRPMG